MYIFHALLYVWPHQGIQFQCDVLAKIYSSVLIVYIYGSLKKRISNCESKFAMLIEWAEICTRQMKKKKGHLSVFRPFAPSISSQRKENFKLDWLNSKSSIKGKIALNIQYDE